MLLMSSSDKSCYCQYCPCCHLTNLSAHSFSYLHTVMFRHTMWRGGGGGPAIFWGWESVAHPGVCCLAFPFPDSAYGSFSLLFCCWLCCCTYSKLFCMRQWLLMLFKSCFGLSACRLFLLLLVSESCSVWHCCHYWTLLIAGIDLANLNLLLLWAVGVSDQINYEDMSCSDFAAVFWCCWLLIYCRMHMQEMFCYQLF